MEQRRLEQVTDFFDEFVKDFSTFDGEVIASRYRVPYQAVNAKGDIALFKTRTDIACYFQSVLNDYYQSGSRSCRYHQLDVKTVSDMCVLATVSWVLYSEQGRELSRWRESYMIWVDGSELSILSSVDH
jgi:hypothetical protein